MIAAMILAAGESRRMGSPKALLPFRELDGRETSFLEHLLAVFEQSDADPVYVVLGHNAAELQAQVDCGDARVVLNDDYKAGMLSSIRAGIEAIEKAEDDVDGVLLCPVDHPDIAVSVVNALIQTFDAQRPPIVLPTHGGSRGHPVLFARAVFDELRAAPDSIGARRVVWDHQDDLVEVVVAESGIVADIDTPADYRALRARGDDGGEGEGDGGGQGPGDPEASE